MPTLVQSLNFSLTPTLASQWTRIVCVVITTFALIESQIKIHKAPIPVSMKLCFRSSFQLIKLSPIPRRSNITDSLSSVVNDIFKMYRRHEIFVECLGHQCFIFAARWRQNRIVRWMTLENEISLVEDIRNWGVARVWRWQELLNPNSTRGRWWTC
jgi:hypothetical protein